MELCGATINKINSLSLKDTVCGLRGEATEGCNYSLLLLSICNPPEAWIDELFLCSAESQRLNF